REHLARRTAERDAMTDRREGKKEQVNGPADPAPASAQVVAPPSPLTRAWDEIYIAEGSDWFWWYGDDHSSAQDALFDYLFRKHLRNVYLLLGDEPPPELAKAIKPTARRDVYSSPHGFLDVKIDGKFTFFEWL